MPTALRIEGYRFKFFGADRDKPPHVHVSREQNEAKYWLDPLIRLARNSGFRPHELTEIERIIVSRRDELLEKWHAFFNR